MDNIKETKINSIFKKAIKNHLANKLEIAENLYLEILKMNPSHLDACNNLGTIYQKKEKFEKAITYYNKEFK